MLRIKTSLQGKCAGVRRAASPRWKREGAGTRGGREARRENVDVVDLALTAINTLTAKVGERLHLTKETEHLVAPECARIQLLCVDATLLAVVLTRFSYLNSPHQEYN